MNKQCLGVSVLAAAVLIVLAACTHRPFHPTKSDREWTIDHKACEVSVRTDIRSDPDTYDALDEMKMIKRCMQEKGWRWERTDLFNFKKSDDE